LKPCNKEVFCVRKLQKDFRKSEGACGRFLSSNGSNFYHMEEGIANHPFAILGLYGTSYAATLHARAMAGKLGVSHVTLLPHLRQLDQAVERHLGEENKRACCLTRESLLHHISLYDGFD